MSDIHGLELSSVTQKDSSPSMQARLSARQARRATKAEDRRQKSDALKEEVSSFSSTQNEADELTIKARVTPFFRNGNFQEAVQRYQQAIDVHGKSTKPVLLTNLAVVYLKLEMYPEAHEAADKALTADPKSVKARYRRAMARKHMKMWTGASLDLHMMLTLNPGNKVAEAELTYLEDKLDDDEESVSFGGLEAPALEDEPDFGESLSESSDCEHTCNGIPCRFYNRIECKNRRACRFSHAPDEKSERDALGRNVCRFYLIGVCKYGNRCSYLHSEGHLLQKGWWSTAEGIDKEKMRHSLIQMCNKAIAEYNNASKVTGTGQKSKKRQPRGKIRSRDTKNSKTPAAYSCLSWGGYDSGADDETGMFGFTGSEVDELLCQGVKPWDDGAQDVLDALYSYY